MRHLNKNMLRIFYILLLGVLLVLPAAAADTEFQPDLRVETTESEGAPVPDEASGSRAAMVYRASETDAVAFTTGEAGLALIKEYEGFSATAYWDVDAYRIGYGTNYTAAEEKYPDNEKDKNGRIIITEEQAVELMRDELVEREEAVNSYLVRENITVNQNQFDALVSFTYNVSTGWMTSQNDDGTPFKIRTLLEGDPAGWTEEAVQEAFGTWVKAGGVVLEGLVRRRAAEATLFVTPYEPQETPEPGDEPTDEPIYKDLVEGAWYEEYVLAAYDLGIMQGMGNGIFDPDGKMTRAQMVHALANFAGVDLSEYQGSEFSDVPEGSWFTPAIAWAVQEKIVNGMGDGTFHPDEPIKREDICSIIARYLRSIGVSAGDAVEPFQDDEEIEPYAQENVYYCATLGLVEGIGDNVFAPKQEASRAQLAKILVCMDRLLED